MTEGCDLNNRPGSAQCARVLLALALVLGCLSSAAAHDGLGNMPDDGAGFGSDRAAAVYFLRPLFPIMDCEGMGVISEGEVEDHFFALFYSVGKRGAFHITRDDLVRSLDGSSEARITHVFDLMDGNGDGRVSTSEFREFMVKAIRLADVEQNGEVSLADLDMATPRIIRSRDR